MIRLMGLPAVSRAPQVRLERTGDEVVLWFLATADDRPVHRLAVPRAILGPDEDLETVELATLARLQDMGYDARRIAPRAEP